MYLENGHIHEIRGGNFMRLTGRLPDVIGRYL